MVRHKLPKTTVVKGPTTVVLLKEGMDMKVFRELSANVTNCT